MLNLNETQEGVLTLVFKIADDNGLLLLDLKDLRAMLQHVGDNAAQFTTATAMSRTASIGAIQRGLLALESQGGGAVLRRADARHRRPDADRGRQRGRVNILAADKLMNSPKLYATFLLWMLSELFEHLPEVGDPDKPKLVFFFDEAHLLFNEAPKALLEKIEQVVRLIRSKGVGVYFVTQNPLDVPETRARPARQPRAARAARLHAARSESGEDRGRRRCARIPKLERGEGDHRARRRRGARVAARREGHARAWSSAPSSCRPAARSARSATTSAQS